MKTFYIDFEGYCTVEAESAEEAEEKFWEGLQSPSSNALNDVYEVKGIEEA